MTQIYDTSNLLFLLGAGIVPEFENCDTKRRSCRAYQVAEDMILIAKPELPEGSRIFYVLGPAIMISNYGRRALELWIRLYAIQSEPTLANASNPSFQNAITDAKRLADELDMPSAERQLKRLRGLYLAGLNQAQIADKIRELQTRIAEDLDAKHFLFIPEDVVHLWEVDDPFKLGRRFREAHKDIQSAGKCLAVGEGTACILHLDRAMEVALRKLAKRLQVTIGPRDTWGGILKKMTPEIEKMRENTTKEKTKKQRWSEARTHLMHIKACWRDRPMHGHDSYSPERAREIYETVRVFMSHLARL